MRQWDRFLERAELCAHHQTVRDVHAQRARRFAQLVELAGVMPVPGKHYVLNLDRSPDRLLSFGRMGRASGFNPARHRGVDAAADDFRFEDHFKDFPEGAPQRIARRKKGGFACFVGHRAIWKRTLSDQVNAAAIYEDDAMPLADPLRYLARHAPPEGWDIIKFSERVEPLEEAEGPYMPIREGLLSHFRHTIALDYMHPPGNDGYLVSPRGAQRLLEIFATVGLPAATDYTIVMNSLVEPLQSGHARLDAYYNGRNPQRRYTAPGRRLETYVTSVALSELAPVASVLAPIRHEDQEIAKLGNGK